LTLASSRDSRKQSVDKTVTLNCAITKNYGANSWWCRGEQKLLWKISNGMGLKNNKKWVGYGKPNVTLKVILFFLKCKHILFTYSPLT